MRAISADIGLTYPIVRRTLTENGIEIDSGGKKYMGGTLASKRRMYKRNRKKILARQKETRDPEYYRKWREENKKKISEYNKAYRKKNKERIDEKIREWEEKNRDHVRQRRTKYQRERRRMDAALRLNEALSTRLWMTLRNQSMKKMDPTFKLLGFTSDEFIAHMKKQFKPGMTLENYGEWHIDHIIPISHFNYTSTDDPDFKKCWSLSNLQPLWASENCSKQDRWVG